MKNLEATQNSILLTRFQANLWLARETKQNTKIIMNQNFTIIASLSKVLKEILELKQFRNNDTFGDFA
jgi:hypothetical protein